MTIALPLVAVGTHGAAPFRVGLRQLPSVPEESTVDEEPLPVA